jgi:hypothetical protein
MNSSNTTTTNSSVFYVKSMEGDFTLKTLIKWEKVTHQTIEKILETLEILPNTISFNEPMRLSTTALSKEYVETYRPEWLIFQTTHQPKHYFPFDLILLSDNDEFEEHYYEMQHRLWDFYVRNLIAWYEKFKFSSFEEMIKTYPSPAHSLSAVNTFRTENWFLPLPESKSKIVKYNEAVFEEPIKIAPIAIYWTNQKSKDLSDAFNLPHFESAKAFYDIE